MAAISDYLLTPALTARSGFYVRFLNNATGTSYISGTPTDVNGLFTMATPPPGSYTVYYGLAATVPGTATPSGDANYLVPLSSGDDAALKSLTLAVSPPYNSTALPGWADASIGDWGGLSYNPRSSRNPSGAAKFDGVTLDTTSVTAAATAAAANGGEVVYPTGVARINASLPIASGVTHRGVSWGAELNSIGSLIATNGAMATPIFDVTAAVNVFGVTWQNLALVGNPTVSGSKGIHCGPNVTARAWTFRDLFLNGFADQAIQIEPGGPSRATAFLENVFAQNGLAIRTGRAAIVGVIDLAFTDVYAFGCFSTASVLTADGTGNIAGWAIRGSNSTYVACYGEISQIGIAVTSVAFWVTLLGCRGYLNNGPGIQLDGSRGQATNTRALSNSQTTDNTSSGFVVTGGGWNISGCQIDGLAGDANQQKNGFDDSNSSTLPNIYSFNRLGQYVRGVLYNGTGTAANVRIETDNVGGILLAHAVNGQVVIDPIAGSSNATLFLQARLAGVAKTTQLYADQNGGLHLIPAANQNIFAAGTLALSNDLQRSRQTPSEAVLVSGVPTTAEIVSVTLTAARVVGAPINPVTGQRLTFILTQGGAGGFAVTWNAIFKKTWADTGNTTGKVSVISFIYDGTNWQQDGAQSPYV